MWTALLSKQIDTHPNLKMTFSVRPVRQVAMASINVVIPKEAWIGTKDALNAAVAPSQQSSIKKLKNPTTNYTTHHYYAMNDTNSSLSWKQHRYLIIVKPTYWII